MQQPISSMAAAGSLSKGARRHPRGQQSHVEEGSLPAASFPCGADEEEIEALRGELEEQELLAAQASERADSAQAEAIALRALQARMRLSLSSSQPQCCAACSAAPICAGQAASLRVMHARGSFLRGCSP